MEEKQVQTLHRSSASTTYVTYGKVQVGNDQKKVQSKRNSHSKTEVGKTKLTLRYLHSRLRKCTH